jgi:hypothetical protein
MPIIDELQVADAAEAWRAIGFTVDDDDTCRVGTVRIQLGGAGTGITGWTLRDVPGERLGVLHENGATRIDHLVLMSPDLPRTMSEMEALGLEARRERNAGNFKQVFFRMGEVILELVGPHEAGPGESHFWGVTFAVPDLDATAEFLGERVGRVKDAVQPGRRITTLRGREIGISPAVAFMSE